MTARWRWKRPLDVILGGALLLFLLPLIAALALLVRLDSPGPGIHRQRRVGRYGQPFEIWRLRTMTGARDRSPHRATAAGRFTGRRFGTLEDARVTRVGRWLRLTSLDGLPQLVNVLQGDMSLVGPRSAIQHTRPWYFERLGVAPGVTGLWQVSRRERLSAAEMMELDLRYVQEASLWLDLEILLWTGPALLLGVLRRKAR